MRLRGEPGFPAVMDPEPVCRVAPNGDLKGAVHIEHNRRSGTRPFIFVERDLLAGFDAPARQAHTIAYTRVERAMIAESIHRRSRRRGTNLSQKWQQQAGITGVLIRQ